MDTDIKKIIETYVKTSHHQFQNNYEFEKIRTASAGSHNGTNLSCTRADLAAEWSPKNHNNMKPENFPTKSNKRVWWVCSKCNHDYEARIVDRVVGRNCLICNSLQKNNPELSKEWLFDKNNGLTPNDVSKNSNQKVWWRCSKYHEWKATIDARNGAKTGCPYCAKRKVGADNNLQKLNPEIAKEWHPTKNNDLTPLDVMPNSKKKVWWQCNKDSSHEYQMIISSKTNGYKCPICSGKVVHIANCLQTKKPEIAKEWHPTKNGNKTPLDFTSGSKFKAWWICPKGHEYQSIILSRLYDHGCPACSNQAKKERAIRRWEKYREDKLKKSKINDN